MALDEVLDRRFDTGQHMDLCTVEAVNCELGVYYVHNYRELMSFA